MRNNHFNPKFNQGFAIKPMPLEAQSVRERRARKTKKDAQLVICIEMKRGAFIWDSPPSSYVLRGWCVVRNLKGYEIFEVYGSLGERAPIQFIENALAALFPLVWDIDLLDNQLS